MTKRTKRRHVISLMLMGCAVIHTGLLGDLHGARGQLLLEESSDSGIVLVPTTPTEEESARDLLVKAHECVFKDFAKDTVIRKIQEMKKMSLQAVQHQCKASVEKQNASLKGCNDDKPAYQRYSLEMLIALAWLQKLQPKKEAPNSGMAQLSESKMQNNWSFMVSLVSGKTSVAQEELNAYVNNISLTQLVDSVIVPKVSCTNFCTKAVFSESEIELLQAFQKKANANKLWRRVLKISLTKQSKPNVDPVVSALSFNKVGEQTKDKRRCLSLASQLKEASVLDDKAEKLVQESWIEYDNSFTPRGRYGSLKRSQGYRAAFIDRGFRSVILEEKLWPSDKSMTLGRNFKKDIYQQTEEGVNDGLSAQVTLRRKGSLSLRGTPGSVVAGHYRQGSFIKRSSRQL
ncbi:MAG: hypothetical protein ACPGUZ_00890 [Holosporaceae bacterium]